MEVLNAIAMNPWRLYIVDSGGKEAEFGCGINAPRLCAERGAIVGRNSLGRARVKGVLRSEMSGLEQRGAHQSSTWMRPGARWGAELWALSYGVEIAWITLRTPGMGLGPRILNTASTAM